MKEKLIPIEGFPDYYISNLGNVYSEKSGELKKLSPYVDSRGRYLQIALIDMYGNRKHCLLHRLVAKAFIPNPNNLPEVNHKDKNTQNPRVDNLEWCTRIDNLYDSYSTMSPVRNFNQCKLYRKEEMIEDFQSIKAAIRYAKENFGASKTSLEKYLRWGDFYIIPDKTDRIVHFDGHIHPTQNRNPIKLYKETEYIGTFKSYREVKEYLFLNYGITVSETTLGKHKQYKTFKLERAS